MTTIEVMIKEMCLDGVEWEMGLFGSTVGASRTSVSISRLSLMMVN